MGILIIILFVIFCLAILAIPSGLTYWLYKYLKKKGQKRRKIGLTIFIVTTVFMIGYSIKFFMEGAGFGPKYDSAKIKQNIGGKLLCKSVYLEDIHNWQYNLRYKYITVNRDTVDLGGGTFQNREWEKDVQLKKLGNWLILKTGDWYGSDRLILRNLATDTTLIYDLTDSYIEENSLWKAQKIKSLLNYCCSETYVESISGQNVIVKYKYRTNQNLTNEYGKRIITFQIDSITGKMKMIKIEK